MLKNQLVIIAINCFLLITVFLTVRVFAVEEVVLVADEWCPYNCAPDSEKPGYLIEMAQVIFNRHDIKVNYTLVPWVRSIKGVRQGLYGGIPGAYIENAPDLVYHSEPAGLSRNVFITLKESQWSYNRPEDLEKIRLGVINDYKYSSQIDDFISANPDKVYVSHGENPLDQLFKLLILRRIDALIDDENVLMMRAGQLSYDSKIRAAGAAEDEYNVYIGFSPAKKQSRHFADIFSNGIKELRKTGELKKILDRYGLDDWK